MLILTDADKVYLNYKKKDKRPVDKLSSKECRTLLEQGQLPPGSMGPKIESTIKFLESGGEKSVTIAPLESADEAMAGRAGTLNTA